MPHDRNGKEVHPGDRVAIYGTIESIGTSEDYCNAVVLLDELMPPYTTQHTISTINTRQLEKLEPVTIPVEGQSSTGGPIPCK